MSDSRYATLSTARYATDHRSEEIDAPRRFPAVHPFLLAACPALALFAQAPATVMPWEVGCAAGVSLAAAGLLYVALRALYRSWQAAALGASWIVLLVFSFGLIFRLEGFMAAQGVPLILSRGMVLPAWGTTLIVGLWWIGRRRADLATLSLCAHVFGAFAIGGPIALVAMDLSEGGLEMAATPAVIAPTEETEEITLKVSEPPRDIFYLVVNGYADYQSLKRIYRFDNRSFLSRLHGQGFAIVSGSHSNYPRADLSMAAALNMHYLGEKVPAKPQTYAMLENHRVGLLLKQNGYDYFHLGGPIDGLRTNPHASLNYEFSRMPSNYTDRLMALTALNDWIGATEPRKQFEEKLRQLDGLAQRKGPKFVFAYFALPQQPWRFNENGQRPAGSELLVAGDRQNYVNQLRFFNQRLGQAIDSILAKASNPPIIVIQSDEGPWLDKELDAPLSPLAQVQKRTRILTAVYLPERDAAKVVPATLSPVNTFRLIFREYFAADLPLLPDRVYYGHPADEFGQPQQQPDCELVDVTGKLSK